MPVITLTLAKIGLMVLLYLFLFWVFRVVGKEVRDTTEPERASPDLALAHLPRLSIIEPRQYRGWTLPLRHDLVIGRGEDCGLQLQDPHASSHHARVTARGAMGGALFVIRLVQPDDFDRIVSDLGISAAAADDLIAAVAGDLHTDNTPPDDQYIDVEGQMP